VQSPKDIRRKIRAVRSIEQITRAMKTVASIRLRRAEQRLVRARPYRNELMGLVSRLAAVTQAHPFLQPRPVARIAAVVVTSDRGLCGGYNLSAVRRALTVGPPSQVAVIAVGRKGLGQMTRRGYKVLDQVVPLGGEPETGAIWDLAGRIGRRYRAGEFDRVVLVYSQFLGGMSARVTEQVVLPIVPGKEQPPDTIFEPRPEELLGGLVERYLRTALLLAALEASASEHAARVAAMTAATDNAEEMIQGLTQDYNVARQAAITRELTEIVGTAEATA
jgi:F-type H+-transporting ATPase subunit gamma